MWAARCTSCGAYVLGDRAPEPEHEMPEGYWEPFRQSAVARWNRRASLAAAFRAAVEQAVPEPPDCGTPANDYVRGSEDRQRMTRFRLLAIAAELEGVDG